MSPSALALVLAAAVLHAGWNVLLAGARDVRAATTATLALSVLLFAIPAALAWDVESAAIPWIAASSLLQLAYFGLLVAAYRASDVSLVYPIARGAAPVLVLLAATVAGSAVAGLQAVGVLLVAAGVLLVRGLSGRADARGVALSLVIAGVIAGYTLVDAEGVESAGAIAYLELALAPVALALLGVEAARGRLGAVRASSILVAVALGAFVLHERITPWRVAGATLLVAGVGLVATG